MISSYLQIDKAKHGERIKALYDDYNRLDRLISEMELLVLPVELEQLRQTQLCL